MATLPQTNLLILLHANIMIQAKLYFDKDMPSTGASIAPGIHDKGDVKFLGIVRNDNSWDIRFGNEQGQFLTKRLFEPNANYMNEGETPSQALQRSIDKNVGIVVRVMRTFLGEAAGNIEGEDYDSFMTNAQKEAEQFIGTVVCLKVIPDMRNDKLFSKIPDYGFIDSYVNGFPTTLYLSKKDKELFDKHSITY